MRHLALMHRLARRLVPRADEGQALVEYSLIFVLVIIVCFTVLGTLSETLQENYFRLIQAMP